MSQDYILSFTVGCLSVIKNSLHGAVITTMRLGFFCAFSSTFVCLSDVKERHCSLSVMDRCCRIYDVIDTQGHMTSVMNRTNQVTAATHTHGVNMSCHFRQYLTTFTNGSKMASDGIFMKMFMRIDTVLM